MTSNDLLSSDNFYDKTTQDSTNKMTAFEDKPLPPVQQSKPRSPDSSNMNTKGSEPMFRSGRNTPQPFSKDKLRKESSRMSLFSLFTRPKVEKLRGYAEPGVILPALDTISSRSQSPEARPVKKSLSDKPLPPLKNSNPSRDSHYKRQSQVDEGLMEGKPRSSRKRNSWVPPPLFQAYSQSLKASKARTSDGVTALQQFRRRTDTSELSLRPEKLHRAGSVSSIKYSTLPKKIFALTRSGHMLQYADQGMVERLPEKILQLKGNSVACACNLVPGEPFVLQIAQDADAMKAGLPSSSISLLSRMGLRSAPTRREATCMFLVLQNADEMNEWMLAVRKKIHSFSGHLNQLDDRGIGQTILEIKSGGEEMKNNLDHHRDLPGLPDHNLPAQKAEYTEDILKLSHKLENLINISEESIGHGLAARQSAESAKSVGRTSTSPSRNTSAKDVHSDEHMSSYDSTPSDSPLSGQIEDPMTHVGKVRKQFPFKIRSTVPQELPTTKPDIGDAPVSSDEQAHDDQRSHTLSTMTTTTESETRPESIVTDLPSFWNPQVLSRATATPMSSGSTAIEANQNDPRLRPFRTSEPSNSRRPTMQPLSLPMKINTSMMIGKDKVLSKRAPPMVESSIFKPPPETLASRRPHRTSSVKLSLFPVPAPTPPPAAVVSVRSITPSHDSRSLRRPSSLQVRSDPAPFLSSVRSASATRPSLNKAGSASSLRSASYAGHSNHGTAASALPPSPAASTEKESTSDHVSSRIDNKIAAISSKLPGQAVLRFPMGSGLPSTAPSSRPATPVHTPTFPPRTSSRDHNSNLTALPPLSGRPLPRASSAQGFYSVTSGRGRPRTGSRFSTIATSQGLPALDLGIPVLALAPPEPPPARDLPSLPAPPAVPPKEGVDPRLLINAR